MTLTPNYPGLQGAAVVGVSNDSAPGAASGSWQANVAVGAVSPLHFTSIIIDTETLFDRDDVRVDELAEVSYWTKKDGPEGAVDWFFQFYTKPYTGSPGATWYGHRINSEPYFSDGLNAPAMQWNQWQSEAGPNRLRFYDSSSNSYFGSYSDPFLNGLATLTYPIPAWNLNAAYDDLGPQEIMYFNFGLGTAWAGGFTGQIDGIRIELTDGSVAIVNLENYPQPAVELVADQSCYIDGVGETITVQIQLTGNGVDDVYGGQFFIQFDNAALTYGGGAAGTEFPVELLDGLLSPNVVAYAVGVTGGDPPTTGSATMGTLTFTVVDADACTLANTFSILELPFGAGGPGSYLTDASLVGIPTTLVDSGPITVDATAPTLHNIPPNVLVSGVDAGLCSAVVDIYDTWLETFDVNPDLAEWIVDRTAPACFQSVSFGGDNRLELCIAAADAAGGTGFNNTQGRKIDPLPDPVSEVQIDLYVPADWATSDRRMAGIWLDSDTGTFAILEFNSGTLGYESTSDDPINAGTPEPRFRAWASGTGWVDMGLPTGFVYDEWHTLAMRVNGNSFTYEVGDLSLSLPANGSTTFEAVFLQGYNTHSAYTTGVTYEILWDDLSLSTVPTALDNCAPSPTVTGVRSDSLPLTDPYPAGITTISWTATDACGNTSAPVIQTIEVIGESQMNVVVEIPGLAPATTVVRCIEFQLDCGAVISQDITFDSSGFGFATITVPCSAPGHGCVTARDPKHTLRAAANVYVVGTEFEANWLAVQTLPDVPNALVSGNANGDGFIDILDYGIFAAQFGPTSIGQDTDCDFVGLHADFSGDGFVNAADFPFIQINFFKFDVLCTCPLPLSAIAERTRPLSRVRVSDMRRMGYPNPELADMNGDGWLDATDVSLFFTTHVLGQ